MSTPFPYYVDHAFIALVLAGTISLLVVLSFTEKTIARPFVYRSAALAGAFAGGMFYLGREIAQWEDRQVFDWPGLIAPVIAVTLYVGIVFMLSRKIRGRH